MPWHKRIVEVPVWIPNNDPEHPTHLLTWTAQIEKDHPEQRPDAQDDRSFNLMVEMYRLCGYPVKPTDYV